MDFWGTLVFEGPRADDRYRERRLTDFETILRAAGFRVAGRALARGYEQSGRELTWVWSENRDVPVLRHVASVLGRRAGAVRAGVERDPRGSRRGLRRARAPGTAPSGHGARAGLEALVARGLRLAVISNTMRTPAGTSGASSRATGSSLRSST